MPPSAEPSVVNATQAVAISAVVCTYNRAESLRETLQSLKRQVLPEDAWLEIVIVDNNSQDDTRAVVEDEARLSAWPIRYVFEGRQGLSCARNAGIRAAVGPIVAFLDDDVIAEPGWAHGVWACMQETGCDAVAGKVMMRWMCPRPSWLVDELRGPLMRQDCGPYRIRWDLSQHMLGANMAFRRDVFRDIGVFDETLGRTGESLIGGEDQEISQRLVRDHRIIVYEPKAAVWHKVMPERVTPAFYRRWFTDIAYTQAHQLSWKWHYRISIVPLWRWSAFAGAWVNYARARSAGAVDEATFQAELWWLFQRSFLNERWDHWVARWRRIAHPRCPFVNAASSQR